MKKCSKCYEAQSLIEFHKNKNMKDGLCNQCKTCCAKYKVWYDMMRRCYDINDKHYKNYGGRGIKVCNEWLLYNNMKNWIEQYWIKGLQIDRIDNDKGYSPENCRFVTRSENNLNRRVYGTIEYRGVCFSKYAKKYKAEVRINGKSKYIGYYNTAIEAAQAYDVYVIVNNLPNQLNGLNKIL